MNSQQKMQHRLSASMVRMTTSMVRMTTSVVRMTTLADCQQNQHDKYLLLVFSVEILLMMDSGLVRNM
jgi:hypothetical protein